MRKFLAIALVAAVSLTACRGGESGTDEAGIKTDVGVTKEACPEAIDKSRGCIYLGVISDLTEGPFRALAVPITDAQKAFWKRVNEQGGIGGYEVDVVKHIKDNKYNAQTHKEVFDQIKGNILALAQTLGSPTTAAILAELKASSIVSVPAAWTSAYAFEDVIIESGANYCFETMNALDYANETYKSKNVLAIHYAGDYGDDAAAGAKIAAAKLGMTFNHVKTDTGAEKQAGALAEIAAKNPDLVILTVGPTETGAIVAQAAARGFKGRFIGTSPTFNPALVAPQSPAAQAVIGLYEQSVPWNSWSSDTPGHKAMREALTGKTPSEGYTSGWVWSYPLLAALKKAAENKDLTRAGVLAAVKSLDKVDYEGMLPSEAGNFKAGAAGQFKATGIYKPQAVGPNNPTGGVKVKDLFVGPTAQSYTLDAPCYNKL